MNTEAVNCFYHFLKQLEVPVTHNTVKDFLLSHPDYPSLVSYSDLCEILKMECIALKISFDQLISKDFPVIAHIYDDRKTFFVTIESIDKKRNRITYYHPNKKTITESIDDFFKKWTGNVFYALPKDESGEEGYIKKRSIEILSSLNMPLLSFLILLLLIIFIFQSGEIYSIYYMSFLLLKAIGLFISINLVSHTLGSSTKISKMVCRQGKYTNCDDVLNSPVSKLFGVISMSDIGLVYFLGSIMSMLLSIYFNISEPIILLLSIISIFSFPYILFSIYYQAFKIQKWCQFCLSVITILFIECLYFLFNIKHFDYDLLDFDTFLTTGFCFIITICLWSVIRSLLLQAQEAEYKYDFLRLKKNPRIFNARFNESDSLEMNFSSSDIVVGNPNAKLTITTVMNTRCDPCAHAHKKIKKILSQYPGYVKLAIRFTTGKRNEEETLHLMELYRIKGQVIFSQALDEWFENKNYASITKKYPVDNISTFTCDLLTKQVEWYNESHFTGTPTIILNDKKIEKEYDIDDIQWLVYNLISEWK